MYFSCIVVKFAIVAISKKTSNGRPQFQSMKPTFYFTELMGNVLLFQPVEIFVKFTNKLVCIKPLFYVLDRMRVFWMRLVWTATAISYLVVVTHHRKLMFINTNDAKYEDDPMWLAMLGVICVEYLMLGLLECVMKITNSEIVQQKIQSCHADLSKGWQILGNLAYHLCLFAYAARSFSLSLHFALLSVATNADNGASPNSFAGPTLVLQIYLAIIRGRFYGFFMREFLSTFLVEKDDPMFDKAKIEKNDDNRDINHVVVEKGQTKEDDKQLL